MCYGGDIHADIRDANPVWFRPVDSVNFQMSFSYRYSHYKIAYSMKYSVSGKITCVHFYTETNVSKDINTHKMIRGSRTWL